MTFLMLSMIQNCHIAGGICNIKSMLLGDFERQIVTLVTAYGRTTTVKQVETVGLVLKDDT